jgi:hypothetical protein
MAIQSETPEPVIINVSPASSLLPNRKFKGEIEEYANKLLILHSDEEIDVLTAITAQSKDLLFMGSVLRCLPGIGLRWTVHIQVDRTLLVV